MSSVHTARPDGSYRTAATTLLRATALDALSALLLRQSWKSVTMSEVAKEAGLSRQTIYNEFGSRRGVAESYAIRLTDRLVSVVDDGLYTCVGDIRSALARGLVAFFAVSERDPLVRSLREEDASADLLRLITVDSTQLVERAADHLSATFQRCWVQAPKRQADILSTSIVQMALAYVSRPPTDGAQTATDIADLLAPYIEGFQDSQAHPELSKTTRFGRQ
ncbi:MULTISPECIES: TetR family transcriptional regulator [Rhodococcus]|jgi:AcrR family transcriptional regulator|uniref:TetR family transcriptional regulator n=1 Tax=Rhodococcus cercidiphylli TaxID=489916 RepID=A0ABU4B4R1_9NOCA|nr:TetR family transcriptional regulator [Rhodococcus cercidiphylli]MDV6233464.1 TetR family transcriptional regulator [Rhodococcus cercidiphylli]